MCHCAGNGGLHSVTLPTSRQGCHASLLNWFKWPRSDALEEYIKTKSIQSLSEQQSPASSTSRLTASRLHALPTLRFSPAQPSFGRMIWSLMMGSIHCCYYLAKFCTRVAGVDLNLSLPPSGVEGTSPTRHRSAPHQVRRIPDIHVQQQRRR